jgi:succinoglycan biosynthesis protein ExoA
MLKREITVVIPAKNEVENIPQVITSIIKQSGSRGLRIIVADGGSTDGTQDAVLREARTHAGQAQIELIKGGSVSRGRNAGLAQVKTWGVVFIDADVELTHPGMLEETARLLLTKRLVGAPLASRSGLRSRLAYAGFNLCNGLISLKHPFAVGNYLAGRTHLIRHWGGFDETLVHSEDWVLSGHCPPRYFSRLPWAARVDDRRFRQFGYLKMFTMMMNSLLRGRDYMRQDNGYWRSGSV